MEESFNEREAMEEFTNKPILFGGRTQNGRCDRREEGRKRKNERLGKEERIKEGEREASGRRKEKRGGRWM